MRIIADRSNSESDLEDEVFDTIDYLEFDKKELADMIYTPIYQSLIKKVELIQNVDLFNGGSANQ